MRILRQIAFLSGAFALILGLAGVMLASAHGQVMARGEVILCSGGGAVVAVLDNAGKPTGQVRLCPDMAPGLVAGLAAPVQLPVRAVAMTEMAPAFVGSPLVAASPVLAANARGPPATV